MEPAWVRLLKALRFAFYAGLAGMLVGMLALVVLMLFVPLDAKELLDEHPTLGIGVMGLGGAGSVWGFVHQWRRPA